MQEREDNWDKIIEQSKRGIEKQRNKEKIENGFKLVRCAAVIISIICIIIIVAVIEANKL